MPRRRFHCTSVFGAAVLIGSLGCDPTAPKVATKLAIVTAPSSSPKSRVAFTTQPAVQLQDADGNAIAQAGTNVTASITSGGGTLGGTSTAATDATGRASFTDLMITGTAGDKVLTFSASGLTSATATVTLSAGAATTMAVNAGASQTGTAGAAVATAPAIKVTDADANAVAGVAVTFAVASGGGAVVGGSATTDATGIAKVTSWTLGTTAGTNTLTATSTGLTGSPITFSATGTAGAAATMAKVAGDAQSATVSTAVAIAPSVKLTDANGNAVASATVTFAVASGAGSVTGASQTTSSSGVATVGSWTLGSAAGANTLTASSTGVTAATFTATATAVATTTTVTFCNSTNLADLPIWFAYQNGTSGTWTQLTANADKSYSVPITSVGGISFVVQQGTHYEHDVLYASKTELAGIGCLGNATGTKTINGSVSGVSATDLASIAFGSSSASASSGTPTFSLTQAADGPRDLIASRGSFTNDYLPTRYIVRRGLNPANGSTLPVLDFAASEALAPSTATYTLSGIGTDTWGAGTFLVTANLTTALLEFTSGTGTGANVATTYQSIAASQRLSSDNYQFMASASATNSDRDVVQNLTTFGNRSVTLGPALSVPTITTAATSPNVRMRMQLASQTAYSAFASAHFFGPGPNNNFDATVTATADYFGGTPATWDLTMPDVSSAGFQAAWGLPTGGAIGWNVAAISSLPFDKTTETPLFAAQRFDDSAFGGQPAPGSVAAAAQRRQVMTRLPWRKQ